MDAPISVAVAALMLGACTSTPLDSEFSSNDEALTQTLQQTAENAERAYNFEAAVGHYSRLAERRPDSIDPILGEARNLRYAGGPADADGDGVVGVSDLLAVLAEWGACG